MNLNKQQQQQWQLVTGIFQGLSVAFSDEEVLATHMKPHIDAFEALTGGKAKVKFHLVPAPSIDWVDCSSDSLKLSGNAKGLVMRACMNGIRISTTLTYADAYAHGNRAVIDALEALKQNLLKLTSDMKDMPAGDISVLIGLAPSESTGQDDDAGGEDGLPPNVLPLPGNTVPVIAPVIAPAVVPPLLDVVEVAPVDVAPQADSDENLMSFESDDTPPEETELQG